MYSRVFSMTSSYQVASLGREYRLAFKNADIRGEYGTEITEGLAYRVAYAFVTECALGRIVVGRDMRLSSPALHSAFIAGARAAGADVLDIGLVTTPMLYFVSGTEAVAGVMITASHSPKNFNGFKLVRAGAVPLTNSTGLIAIKKRVPTVPITDNGATGTLQKKSVYRTYEQYVRSKIAYRPQHSAHIVIDAGNGMATLLAPLLKKYTKLSVEPIGFTLDGSFPLRGSNPTLAQNQKLVTRALRASAYDFGVAFDGDADRIAFFDERGRYVNAAAIGALLATHFVTADPTRSCVYTTLTSRAYQSAIEAAGGTALKARVGHSYIKELMRKRGAFFACEHSAHFYYRDNFYADSGIMTLLFVLQIVDAAKASGLTFSALLAPFTRTYQTEDYMIAVADKKRALALVTTWLEAQQPTTLVHFDGIKATYRDAVVVIKSSVTEDALNIMVEAETKKIAEGYKATIVGLVKGMSIGK